MYSIYQHSDVNPKKEQCWDGASYFERTHPVDGSRLKEMCYACYHSKIPYWDASFLSTHYSALAAQSAELAAEQALIADVAHAARIGQSEDPLATLLHWAARLNKIKAIPLLLKDPSYNVLALDSSKKTALEVAVACGHEEATLLLKNCPAQVAEEKRIALALEKAIADLFCAISNKNVAGVEDAIKRGVKVSVLDQENFSPLLRAAQAGDVAILEILLREGADLNAVHNRTGNSALYEAALKNQFEAVVWLLEKKVIANFCNLSEESALHACARSGSIAIAKQLQSKGVSLSHGNQDDQTPLMLAIIAGKEEFVNWLLENRVQWDVVDCYQKTALDYAKEKKLFAISSALTNIKKQGGSTKIPDGLGKQEATTPSSSKSTTPPTHSISTSPITGSDTADFSASASSASLSSTPKKPTLDEKGGIWVQFTIPFDALTISSETLGSGGFGIVYRGQYNFVDVAIKCLHAHRFSETALEEFKTESLIMGGMNHPHVMKPMGACFEPGHYSLVMELMPKGSLHDLLRSKKDIPWTIRVQIATDISSGLAYLHSQKIIHRDLKSMNVLLDGSLHAKISDFGLAMVKLETQSTTQIGAKAAGTTRWMAPELFKRGSKCTYESDMYSFGMVLWELASRQFPYADGNDMQAMGWIKDGEKETIPADCPPEMAQVITDCWKTNPAERPSSAATSKTLSTWCRFFQGEEQSVGVSTRTEMREGMKALQKGQEEIGQKVDLAIALQVPPIPSPSFS
jgi:ankyrin repeat protein